MSTDDFVFCDERWHSTAAATPHWCAEHAPGHERHVCCCGDEKPEGDNA